MNAMTPRIPPIAAPTCTPLEVEWEAESAAELAEVEVTMETFVLDSSLAAAAVWEVLEVMVEERLRVLGGLAEVLESRVAEAVNICCYKNARLAH
jgi:hypothetical protein